ncbi:MAG: hypothetical protein N2578_10115 [Bdellovibrionaceae bacterium]|nr:hypothetical protein [Pseudobdellovibrionaceae bacterium]
MMQKKGLLPAEWSSIKTVAYTFNSSSMAQSLLRAEPIPIPTKPNGTTRLEVDFLSMDEETAASTIAVQFSLFDLASDNKLWEGAKTYNIGQFLKSEQQKEKTRPEN